MYMYCTCTFSPEGTRFIVVSCGSHVADQAGAYLQFLQHEVLRSISTCRMVCQSSIDHRVTPSVKFACTHLQVYTLVERGTLGIKSFAQEYSAMSLAETRVWTTQSRVERTNHEPTDKLLRSYRCVLGQSTCSPSASATRGIIGFQQIQCTGTVQGSWNTSCHVMLQKPG